MNTNSNTNSNTEQEQDKEQREAAAKLELVTKLKELVTLKEAAAYVAAHLQEFRVSKAPAPDTLRKAAVQGRLVAVLKSDLFITSVDALHLYFEDYDPRNRASSRPVLNPKAREKTRRHRERNRQARMSDPA